MGKNRTKSADLSDAAVVERAKSMANDWMFAVSLQNDRIVNPRPQDQPFHPFGIQGFNEADVHFWAIALQRLRQIATTVESAPQQWDPVRRAIETFDAKLPWLKRLRDVFEHLQDYAIDSNLRHTPTSRRELQVWSGGEDGLNWLGYDVDWREAHLAAKDLYASVKAAYDSLAAQAKQKDSHLQEGEPG
ncbi:MAG TPA: hypothetical protein VMV10_14945 [Pirellulales bacterium]|nr:hypothetical protein [Pirellulales bacterium]